MCVYVLVKFGLYMVVSYNWDIPIMAPEQLET